MSEILLLHRVPHQITPLEEWLQDTADRITLVTSAEAEPDYAGLFPRVIGVPDYSTGPGVEQAVERVCSERPISRLVHVTEDDVLRAATARDRFGLPGPGRADVLPWRDKYAMKTRVAAAGIPTAAFLAPHGRGTAHAFADAHSYPVVVKPRLGYSSHGVAVVSCAAELDDELRERDPDDLLIESFVPGAVYHVDGFAADGTVSHVMVSRYLNGCLAFQDGEPLGSVQLDAHDPLVAEIAALTRRIVRALPALEFCPYHLELFRRPDGELVFCEIACRLGGGHIMESFTRTTGVNPARRWIRHQIGLDDGPLVCDADRGLRHGWLLVPPRTGRLSALAPPDAAHRSTHRITDFVVKTSIPATFDGAHGSTDSIVGYVVAGADSDEVESNLRACASLTDRLAVWEPA